MVKLKVENTNTFFIRVVFELKVMQIRYQKNIYVQGV